MGGGGGAPTETKSTVTQTNLPEYVRPYFERYYKEPRLNLRETMSRIRVRGSLMSVRIYLRQKRE